MYTSHDLKKIYEPIFKASKADETEVYFHEFESATTRFSNNNITQNLSRKDKSISIKVIKDNRLGLAETNDFTAESLTITLEKALSTLEFQKENPKLPTLSEPQDYIQINQFDEETASLSPITKAEWVKKAVDKAKENNFISSGIFSNGWKLHSLANSKGLFSYHKYSEVDFNLSLERNDQSGWYEQSSYNIHKIDLDTIINKALDTAIKSESPISLEPGNYTVILSPEAMGELIHFLAFDGLNTLGMEEKSNFFYDKLGKKVFSDKITIWDDVSHPLSGGLPFDFEGMPRQKIKLIDKGILKDRVLDRRLGEKLNKPSTGHSLPQPNSYGPLPLNLVMDRGDKTIDELISSTNYGLYINRFHYTNILDPMNLNLTGMTRDGLFLIENGKLTKAVKNFRFTESLIKAFNSVEDIENKSTFIRSFFGGGFVVSGMKINDFHFSSKTEF